MVEYVYASMEKPADSCQLYPENVLALDPGLNNWLTGVTNTGKAFILDGKDIKARNQWYNKELARLKSILTHGQPSQKGGNLEADSEAYPSAKLLHEGCRQQGGSGHHPIFVWKTTSIPSFTGRNKRQKGWH